MFDANITIHDPGFYTTVQDNGRIKGMQDGFPESGAMDPNAYHLANTLLSNDLNDACLEFTMKGFKATFSSETFIVITGGEVYATLNQQPILNNQVIKVNANDELSIGTITNGHYSYLGIRHGIQTIPFLNSRSTTDNIHVGGLKGRNLKKGDILPYWSTNQLDAIEERCSDQSLNLSDDLTIDILPGPQIDQFDKRSKEIFLNNPYQLTTNISRMGYRLNGESLNPPKANMLSEATAFGGIQITREGKPIVLMADRQTTGGYPVIGIVITADLSKLVQSGFNTKFQFNLVDLKTAEKKLFHQADQFKKIKHKLYRSIMY